YYPMIAALARREEGEAILHEKAGTGISSFPIVSIAPHAACVALFGTAGFVVADILVTLAFYAVVLLFLSAVRIASPWRECLALFLVCGGSEVQYRLMRASVPSLWEFFVSWDLTFWVWGERVPRPFVSELFLLLALTFLLKLIWSRAAMCRVRTWL